MLESLEQVDHVRGKAGAPVILEYGDYECPYSRQAFRSIERVERELAGGVRFAFRTFPLRRSTRTRSRPLRQPKLRAGELDGGTCAVTLPELHLADWRPTKDTLHLYCQIVGKIRLATTPPRNHWWNVPLYVDVRGLTTRRLHHRETTFDITLDLVDHTVVVRTADGRGDGFELHDGLDVAEFDRRLHGVLGGPGVDVDTPDLPFGVPMTTPFPSDHEHAAWDREYVERFWETLDWTDRVLEEFSGWFKGKTSPVHLFWHGFDLAVTRFSGRDAPPVDADPVTREAYSSEVISFGFWAGDDNGDAAFYSYTAPEPDGLHDQPLIGGTWTDTGNGSLAILPHETVRQAADPRTTLLAFLQSAYEAGARTAGWDTSSFESTWCPTPGQLEQLRTSAATAFGRPTSRTAR